MQKVCSIDGVTVQTDFYPLFSQFSLLHRVVYQVYDSNLSRRYHLQSQLFEAIVLSVSVHVYNRRFRYAFHYFFDAFHRIIMLAGNFEIFNNIDIIDGM